ncbi:prepilin peptidase [Paenibacillus sp. JX-17]|uniref:Prepilin peptidase n=1 Tax=Paenibacillus lacisoli TaxID=3064525 RepID=A0ABT9CFZ3_9BACL|nr:A24 family peptidase [Paenibacillus sp. JX-17]MDO7906596.1 prepilin peptidase [Paenibacillus sp. JX-17]
MHIILAVYTALLGLLLGSFYNVVGLRVPAGESIIHPPSSCPSCCTRLRSRDLVPVFSYLFSRGKCRHCGAGVSVLYPLGELATSLLFLWMVLELGFTWTALNGLLLVSLSIIITISDLKYMLIPNKVLLFFLPLLAVVTLLAEPEQWLSHLLGLLLGGALIGLVVVLSRGRMGMGDLKLLALLGWVLGAPQTLLAFMLACALGSLVGGVLLGLKIITRSQPVPFGPWLAAGALVSYVYGSQIISGYLSLLG